MHPTTDTHALRAALAALYGHDERGRFADIARAVLDDVWEVYTRTGYGSVTVQVADQDLAQCELNIRKRKEK